MYHLQEEGKEEKGEVGWFYNSSTSGASNNNVNTMEMFAGDGDNNELGNSQMGGEATYKSPSSPIEVRDKKVAIFYGCTCDVRGRTSRCS